MNKMFVMLAALVLVAGCVGQATVHAPSQNQSGLTEIAVASISNFAFTPAEITVSAGDTVSWMNNDPVTHTITGDGFDSGPLESGKSFQHKFETPGTYEYHCSIHPSMKGTVIVK